MESLMKEILEEIRNLWDTLMGLEMELVDQLEVRWNLLIDFMNFLELKTKEQQPYYLNGLHFCSLNRTQSKTLKGTWQTSSLPLLSMCKDYILYHIT